MFIHRRAPKSVTSRGTDFGDSEANPGPPKTPKTPSKSWSWRPIFGGFPGGLWGCFLGVIFGPKMGVFGPPRKHGFSGGPGGRKSPHLNTPRGGCSGPLDPPVPQKRWKKGPVEPFFRCFQKYPPRYAKNNSKIVGVVGGGSKTPPKIQPKNAHFCTGRRGRKSNGRG
jgi:hypothetical protein